MYQICYQQVSGGYLQPEPTMYSRCFCWFPGPLAPSVTIIVDSSGLLASHCAFVLKRCAYSQAPSVQLYLMLLNSCTAWLAANLNMYVRNRLHTTASNIQLRLVECRIKSQYHSSATPSNELYIAESWTNSLSGPHIQFNWKYNSRWSNHLVKIPLSFWPANLTIVTISLTPL